MTRICASLLFAVVAACSVASAQTPPVPLASAKDYPASKAESQYAIGAKMLSKTQIQNSFSTPLAGRYVVVEVGFYPADGESVELQRSNFALLPSDSKSSVAPISPAEIASIVQQRPSSSRDVTLYPTANIGYESWPVYSGNGVKRVGGPVYGAGMGVGVGKTTSPATTDSDRTTMETELSDKELKGGDISKPVAGYLYFPVTGKEKATYRLQYRSPKSVSDLPLKAQ